MTRYL